jgi:hypothetical protein
MGWMDGLDGCVGWMSERGTVVPGSSALLRNGSASFA